MAKGASLFDIPLITWGRGEKEGKRERERTQHATQANERKHGALRPQKPLRLIRDGEVGGSGILYLTLTRNTVTTRMILH